ncbi:something about silencing protein 10 [Coemansia sp. RSA 451]|nr:something about silencing protein 10 [Coemansia sp. RSA 1752]KAJ1790343.1 something about silencing protein 10 [Coemansia sp. RSA 1938]KAJ2280201.1 something about silencing protein 10 [Coemansia sp. RSA 451]
MGRRAKTRSGKKEAVVDEEAAIRAGASVKAIRTLDDVEQESADEFDTAKDRVLMGHTRHSAISDESDQEVLGVRVAGGSSDNDSGSDDDGEAFYSDSDNEKAPVWGDDGAWGKQKHNYYDADDIGSDSADDEVAAREEEEEALRLQRKHVEALDEGDFIDELGVQLGVGSGTSRLVAADDGSAQLDLNSITLGAQDMSAAQRAALLRLPVSEKLRVLQAESPELLSLVADMRAQRASIRDEIAPVLQRASALGVRTDDHPALAFYAAKFQLAMSYINNIAVYLVMKASTHEQRAGVALREHPVIGALVEFRRRLEMMDALQDRLAPLLELFAEELASGSVGSGANEVASESEAQKAISGSTDAGSDASDVEMADVSQPARPKKRAAPKKSRKPSLFLEPAAESGDSYSELQALLKKSRSRTKAAVGWDTLLDGDLGDQDRLADEDAEDKARAIRRLRNHAKRVVQARSKREAREHISGDTDVPYKSRVERQRGDAPRTQQNADLDQGMDLDDQDDSAPAEDDYYAEIVQRKQRAAAEKEARVQEQWRRMADANAAQDAAVDDEAKRSVNYQILKNKGMMPRRSKDNRNPRVKRRKRYEKAQKKLSSSTAQVRSQEGNYGGEATGIKSSLSRSTRFK